MLPKTTLSLLIAACAVNEVVSGPTPTHMHQSIHQKKDVSNIDWSALDWNNMGIDWAAAYAKGHPNPGSSPAQAPPEAAAPVPAAAAPPAPVAASPTPLASETEPHENLGDSKGEFAVEKPASNPNSSNNSKPGKSGSSATLWNNLVGASNHRKTFGLKTPTRGKEVGYLSNVGIPEGSNMIKVESAETQTFTNTFINTSQKSMTVVIWNKAASPGMQDPMHADPNLGASIAPEHPALTLALAPGDSQVVAFLDESVIGWAQATESRAVSGGFSTTWGEAQFNTTGSGYDVSAIQNPNGSTYIMEISSVEANSCDSTQTENMWITDTRTTGSGSCFIAQSVAHLTTKMGGYAS